MRPPPPPSERATGGRCASSLPPIRTPAVHGLTSPPRRVSFSPPGADGIVGAGAPSSGPGHVSSRTCTPAKYQKRPVLLDDAEPLLPNSMLTRFAGVMPNVVTPPPGLLFA